MKLGNRRHRTKQRPLLWRWPLNKLLAQFVMNAAVGILEYAHHVEGSIRTRVKIVIEKKKGVNYVCSTGRVAGY